MIKSSTPIKQYKIGNTLRGLRAHMLQLRDRGKIKVVGYADNKISMAGWGVAAVAKELGKMCKKIIGLSVGLLMLTGCSTKVITTSNGRLDMSQIPPVFSEKRDYQIKSFKLVPQPPFGFPGLVAVDAGTSASVTAQEMLEKMIPMCIITDGSILAMGSNIVGTANTMAVRKLYKENHISGVRVVVSPELVKGYGPNAEVIYPDSHVVPFYTTYMEWDCEDSGCKLIKENIDEDSAFNKMAGCTEKVIAARESKGVIISTCESWGWK